jgi:hypothetical protein
MTDGQSDSDRTAEPPPATRVNQKIPNSALWYLEGWR